MTREEQIEKVARAMCAVEWMDPDTLIIPGVPLLAPGGVGYAARRVEDAQQYWTFKRREAEAAIDAIAAMEKSA